jgi:hypothetical protein
MARKGNSIKIQKLFFILIEQFIRNLTLKLLREICWTIVTGDWSEAFSLIFEFLSDIFHMSAPEMENLNSDVYGSTLMDRREEERVERERLNQLFNEEMGLLSDQVFQLLAERGIPFEEEEDVDQALDAVMSRGPELDRELDSNYVRQVRERLTAPESDEFWERLQAEIEAKAEQRRQSPYWRRMHQ